MAKQTFTTGQVLTAAQVNSLQANDFNQTVSAKTASYVLVASDKGTRIEFNTSGSVTCTVNTGLFDAGDTVYIQNRGSGVVTITAGTATVNTSASLAVNQWEGGLLYFISASAAIWYEYASTANGDITGVTAGTGISGGGTSGDVTITNSMATAIDAKGDLIAGTADNTFSRLAAGSNGETLVADSSTSTGLRYNPQNALANPVINGGFDIWQRGTTFTDLATNIYCADRWTLGRAGGVAGQTVSRQTVSDSTNLPNIQYAARSQRTASNSSTAIMYLVYSMETTNSIPFAGKNITYSFYARRGANYSASSNALGVNFTTSTGTDQTAWGTLTGAATQVDSSVALTTSWQRFVFNITVPTNSTQLTFFFKQDPIGTAGANDWFEVTGVQIDLGTYTASSAPTFRRSGGTLAGELAAAMRYYEKSYDTETAPANTSGGGKINFNTPNRTDQYAIEFNATFRVTKRALPTVTIYSPSTGTAARVRDEGSGNDRAAVAKNIGFNNAQIEGDTGVTTTANALHSFQWVASAEL